MQRQDEAGVNPTEFLFWGRAAARPARRRAGAEKMENKPYQQQIWTYVLDLMSETSSLCAEVQESRDTSESRNIARKNAIDAAARGESWAIALLYALSLREMRDGASQHMQAAQFSLDRDSQCAESRGASRDVWLDEVTCLALLQNEADEPPSPEIHDYSLHRAFLWVDAELPFTVGSCDKGSSSNPKTYARREADSAPPSANKQNAERRGDALTDSTLELMMDSPTRPRPRLRGRLRNAAPAPSMEAALRPKGPGFSPLAAAAQQARAELAALLLAAGADPARMTAIRLQKDSDKHPATAQQDPSRARLSWARHAAGPGPASAQLNPSRTPAPAQAPSEPLLRLARPLGHCPGGLGPAVARLLGRARDDWHRGRDRSALCRSGRGSPAGVQDRGHGNASFQLFLVSCPHLFMVLRGLPSSAPPARLGSMTGNLGPAGPGAPPGRHVIRPPGSRVGPGRAGPGDRAGPVLRHRPRDPPGPARGRAKGAAAVFDSKEPAA